MARASSDEDVEEEKAEELNEKKKEDEDSDESDDDGFDFGEIAEQAAMSVMAKNRRLAGLPQMGLDVGLDEHMLYFSSSAGSGAKRTKAFDTEVPQRPARLDVADFSEGYAPSAPSPGQERREVRGVAPRPTDDRATRKKEARKDKDERLEKWFGLRKREHTPDVVKELKAIKLRSAADPKRFYKANDSKELPKYFTFATEVGGGMEAAGEKASRQKEITAHSGRSLLDTIMRDDKVQEFTRKKYNEVGARGVASKFSGHGQGYKKKRGGAWKKSSRGGKA